MRDRPAKKALLCTVAICQRIWVIKGPIRMSKAMRLHFTVLCNTCVVVIMFVHFQSSRGFCEIITSLYCDWSIRARSLCCDWSIRASIIAFMLCLSSPIVDELADIS